MRTRLTVPTRFFICTLVTIFVLACGAAGAAPSDSAEEPPQTEATQPQPAETFVSVVPTSEGQQFPIIAVPEPAIPEMRRLTLEYPPRIRAGDSDIVRLTLEVDESGNITPTAVIDGNVVIGEAIEIPNLYETHHVVAEASFEVAGLQVSPPDLSSQPLGPGQTVRFFWSILPADPGMYRGTVWLHLRFVDKVSGEESRIAVSAQIVEIEAVNLFGVPANVVRFAGGAGSIIGSILGFPFFTDIVRALFGRRRKRAR